MAAVGCSGSGGAGAAGKPLELNRPAAGAGGRGLTLPKLGGGSVSLADHRGKLVLVTLFTTWSLRSQAEAPRFIQYHERLGPRGLKVLPICLDLRSHRHCATGIPEGLLRTIHHGRQAA